MRFGLVIPQTEIRLSQFYGSAPNKNEDHHFKKHPYVSKWDSPFWLVFLLSNQQVTIFLGSLASLVQKESPRVSVQKRDPRNMAVFFRLETHPETSHTHLGVN